MCVLLCCELLLCSLFGGNLPYSQDPSQSAKSLRNCGRFPERTMGEENVESTLGASVGCIPLFHKHDVDCKPGTSTSSSQTTLHTPFCRSTCSIFLEAGYAKSAHSNKESPQISASSLRGKTSAPMRVLHLRLPSVRLVNYVSCLDQSNSHKHPLHKLLC